MHINSALQYVLQCPKKKKGHGREGGEVDGWERVVQLTKPKGEINYLVLNSAYISKDHEVVDQNMNSIWCKIDMYAN